MRITCLLLATLSLALPCLGAPAALPRDAWVQHRADTLKIPGLERFYTFEDASTNAAPMRDALGEGRALAYRPVQAQGKAAEPLRLVEGRWTGKPAVRLDQGTLAASAVEVTNRSFTVAGWFRVNGPGTHRGNNDAPNGTLLACGDGYWNGWRLTMSYPQRSLGFEIGRPKPSSSIGVNGGLLGDGAWHHLAATWDGKEMRLYLDGLTVAATKHDGVAAPGGQFRIGYNNAGMGSLLMDVDEVAVYKRPLAPEEILRAACDFEPVPPDFATTIEKARVQAARKEFNLAEKDLVILASRPALPPSLAALAKLRLAEVMRANKKPARAAEDLVKLLKAPRTPAAIANSAAALLVRTFADAPGAAYSQAAVETVLEMPGLSAKERLAASLQLAQALRDSGSLLSARQLYTKLLASGELSPRQQWDARLTLAHASFEARQYTAAREEYGLIRDDTNAPAHYRSLAQLRLAQSFTRENNSPAAKTAYARVKEIPGVPASHVWEADQCMRELERVAQGLPARDPAEGRTTPPALPSPGLAFYLSPNGDDANPGTTAKPFATLARAREAARKASANGLPAGGIAVVARGGEYPVKECFKLGAEDSGTPERPVVYRAWPGESPRFSGGARLSGFQVVRDQAVLNRLPPEVRGKVWQANLRALGITDYGTVAGRGTRAELFFNGRPLPLARWPNAGFLKVGELLGDQPAGEHGLSGNKVGKFTFAEDRPNRWKAEPEIWLYGYWFWDWADEYQKVASLDLTAKSFTLAQPYSGYGYRKGQRYYALNLLSEIDEPGEWHLDRATGMLYVYPPSDPNRAQIELSLLNGPMVQITGASHLVLQGLTFETGRGDGAVVEGGASVMLAGCTFRRLGENGILVNSGANHTLFGCEIYTLGRGGVRLRGGGRKTLTPSGHLLENCHIHDFSRFVHTYAPAVLAEGVGVRIAHNQCHDSTSSAMRIEGNDHVIEFNEIYRVVTESDDQGGADLWGNPGYRGVVFRYNYWHHIGNDLGVGQAGIRLDDAISEVLIYGNIFYRCAEGLFGGVQIHGGKENVVENNLFIGCQGAVSFSSWGDKRWREFLASPISVRRLTQEVDIHQPPFSTRYPNLARLEEDHDHNFIWRNLVFDCRQFLMRDPGLNDTMDNYLASADPGFANALQGNFRLPDKATIYDRFSLRPIPVDAIGLYPDPRRAVPPQGLTAGPKR
jgi:hypothetical protein